MQERKDTILSDLLKCKWELYSLKLYVNFINIKLLSTLYVVAQTLGNSNLLPKSIIHTYNFNCILRYYLRRQAFAMLTMLSELPFLASIVIAGTIEISYWV